MTSQNTITLWIEDGREAAGFQRSGSTKRYLIDNPKLTNAAKSTPGMYLLIAIGALQQHGDSATILRKYGISATQVNELLKPIIDKTGRGEWDETGWPYFFFEEHPVPEFLTNGQETDPFRVKTSPNVTVTLLDDLDNSPITDMQQIISFIEKLLGIEEDACINNDSVEINVEVTDTNGCTRTINNINNSGILRSFESTRVTVHSKTHHHFYCFWIDPGGRLTNIYPNLEKEKGFEEYRCEYTKINSISSGLITPSNNTFDVPATRGMAIIIVLSSSKMFSSFEMDEISERLCRLIKGFSFHSSSINWRFFHSFLAGDIQDRIKIVRRMGILPKTSSTEWSDILKNQMTGLAERVDALYIPQNPPNMNH